MSTTNLKKFTGRTMLKVTSLDLLGHEDVRTIIQYLGLNMDDKESAMKKLAEFENALKWGKNPSSSVLSGQSGT